MLILKKKVATHTLMSMMQGLVILMVAFSIIMNWPSFLVQDP